MNRIDKVLSTRFIKPTTVNSIDKSLTTVNSRETVNSKTKNEKINEFLDNLNIEPDGIAKLLSEYLDDSKSLEYYRILVRENSPVELLSLAHYVKEMDKIGKIHTNKPIYFQGILRRKGCKTKFKNDKRNVVI